MEQLNKRKMAKAVLSVITINKNNLHGLRKTMESILMQDNKQYEWIIIDGGSADGSVELIKENAKHISCWVSEPDNGIYQAMNKGIALATGDYIHFLNSGDCYVSDSIVKQFISNNFQDDFIYGNAIVVDETGREVGQQISPECINLSYFWSNNLNHQSVFYHRRCFENYMFNEHNRVLSDKESYMYLLYHGYTFRKWNQDIVYYDNGGISSNGNGSEEFPQIISRILPEGILNDYETLIKYRDVDLAIMIMKVINTNKFWRNITRFFLYPICYLSQKCH